VRDESATVSIRKSAYAPFPRAMLFHSTAVAPPADVLKRLVNPDFDLRHILLMEPPFAFHASPEGQGKATVLNSTINTLDLQVTNDAPAVLLVTDAYSRGWHAYDRLEGEQREYPVVPADHAFIGIPLPAGEHLIHLEYRPRTLWVGILLSAIGLLLLLLLAWRSSPLSRKIAKL